MVSAAGSGCSSVQPAYNVLSFTLIPLIIVAVEEKGQFKHLPQGRLGRDDEGQNIIRRISILPNQYFYFSVRKGIFIAFLLKNLSGVSPTWHI
jgi:hypothetical protein